MCRGPLAVGVAPPPPPKVVTEAEVNLSVGIVVGGAGCIALDGR